MKIVFSHVTGNPNSKQAALCLAENDWLEECHTTLSWNDHGLIPAALPASLRSQLQKRAFPGLVRPFLRLHPLWELLRLVLRNRTLPFIQKFGGIDHVAERFDHAVAKAVGTREKPCAVYAYMDAAEQSFRAAKKLGGRTIYELPTPYWRATREIVRAEAMSLPAWAATLPALEEDSPKMQRRDRELQLADLILVPSNFVRDSLNEAPGLRGMIEVVPYGCPPPSEQISSVTSEGQPLRVLFVGSLNQGKGLSYLEEAMRRIGGKAILTVIGSPTSSLPCPALRAFLTQNRHLSGLSNAEVLQEMKSHDVLVLPSLYEGLALVVLEALSQGLAVITTPHSGIEGLLKHGEECLIIPPRDAGQLADNLTMLINNPFKLALLKEAATTASRRLSWNQYRQTLRCRLEKVFL